MTIAYFSGQLDTICAVVKSKCSVAKGIVGANKCRNSGENGNYLSDDSEVLFSYTSCLKYALIRL